MGLVSSCCSGRPGRDVTETKKHFSSCSATGETFDNQFVANDIRGTVDIMTMHRAVFVAIFLTAPSSNIGIDDTAVSIRRPLCQSLHVKDKSNTDNS